ncbi:MAG: thymidine phosphorylase [Chloroflexi bacterium]|nr:thymidine phosphorylase [Chloroflexota bacterium]
MRAVDLIARKRDGQELSASEIEFLVDGFTRGDIPDYQVSAWLMAVYLRGMTSAETAELTLAMARSGQVLDLSDVKASLAVSGGVPPLIADKHSTGGVGDKTTLTVLPIVASCGVPVGKMSGRGLGHTGGTLDKLESIPGFCIDIDQTQFKRQLADIGLVLAGQTHDLAPADGRLYALRDVTATVASMPLIASSIMSKKIAAGADAIVLDVKVGRGAFMQTEADAVALARTMVDIGDSVGRKVSALIADMNQPLGTTVGNALEVMEAVAALMPGRKFTQGALEIEAGEDFCAHCEAVAAEMLQLTGHAASPDEAIAKARQVIHDGRALAKFRSWIAAQGGDTSFLDGQARLPLASLHVTIPAPRDGYVAGLDALAVGTSAMHLGAGRARKSDSIDLAVGVVLHKKVGDRAKESEPLFSVHANDASRADAAQAALLSAYAWSGAPVARPPHVHRIIR